MTGSPTAERITEQYAKRCDHQACHQRAQRLFTKSLFERAVAAVRATQEVKVKDVLEAEQLCRSLYPNLTNVLDRFIARQTDRGIAETITESAL